jgi:DNA polymerase V
MDEVFGLIDCNNFYVSCERLFRPDLEGKPVIVLSNNDGNAVSRSNDYVESGQASNSCRLFK